MARAKDDTAQAAARITMQPGPPPSLGQTLYEREIPSDTALVTPLVVRVVEFLKHENLAAPSEESKIALCLEEALQNAVKHGNKNEFKRKVRLRVFLDDSEWGAVISDEGAGFDLGKIRDPLQSEGLWGESGRGLYLMSHYMDRVEYFLGGRTLVIAKKL